LVPVGGRWDRAAAARERGSGGSAPLEVSVERSRPRVIAERLRAVSGWLAQAALATAAALVPAHPIFGHERSILAPWLR
jgi:hypothetical protein